MPQSSNPLKVILLALVLIAPSLLQAEEKSTVLDIGSRRELFVDDYLIESLSEGLAQQLHKPEPREMVLTTGEEWEGNISGYYTVFQDDDLYRMYYRGSHYDTEAKKTTHREVTCYAESSDGIHWTKPKLGLHEFNGSKENNIILDGIGTHCFAAFKDKNPNCPPEARYKGISRGRPNGKRGLYIFQSPDGIHWSLIEDEPVITRGAFDSQNLAFWNPHTKKYHEYHRIFTDGVRAIMTGTSDNYREWTDPVLLSYQDEAPNQHLYTNAVLPYSRAPHLYLGFPTRYLPSEGHRVEPTFMTSRDGTHFHRWMEPIIPETAPEDRGGNRSNYLAWGLVELPHSSKHLSVYGTEAYYAGPDSRLRRFEYRKDGFVSLQAGNESGELLTKPLTFQGDVLTLNFATEENGSIQVELLDEAGQPISGFQLENCDPLTGDHLNKTVTWKNNATVSSLSEQPVRLRIVMNQANLYSLKFSSP